MNTVPVDISKLPQRFGSVTKSACVGFICGDSRAIRQDLVAVLSEHAEACSKADAKESSKA